LDKRNLEAVDNFNVGLAQKEKLRQARLDHLVNMYDAVFVPDSH
jgi:hypothetical protein